MQNENIYIYEKDVNNKDYFESLVRLHNCIYALDDDWYIIEGSAEDIESFSQDWIAYKELLYDRRQ